MHGRGHRRRRPRLRLGMERHRRAPGQEPAAVVRDLPRRVRRAPAPARRSSRRSRPPGRCCSSRRRRVPRLVAGQPRRRVALPRRDHHRARRARPAGCGGHREGPGVGTLCLGIAFLFIAVVRAATRGRLGLAGGPGRDPVRHRRVQPRGARGLRADLADPAGDPRRDPARPCLPPAPVPAPPAAVSGPSGPLPDHERERQSRASRSPSAIRASSSSVTTNGGPSRTMSPSTPFAFPVPE